MTATPLLEVSGLKMHFDAGRKKAVKAVDGVSFHIKRGETFGLHMIPNRPSGHTDGE